MLTKYRLWLCACLLLALVLLGTGCSVDGVMDALNGTTDTEPPVGDPIGSEEDMTLGTVAGTASDTADEPDTDPGEDSTEETTAHVTDTDTETAPATETDPAGETETAPPHAHTYTDAWSQDADDHWHAATCGHDAEVRDKAAHTWDGGTVAQAATCEREGITRYTCTVCRYIDTEPIPATGHTEATVGATAVTCTQDGRTAGTVCTVCDAVLQGCETIPATGHTEAIIPGVAPTCTEGGWTDGLICTVCGETLRERESIPATGHTEAIIPGVAPTCTETGLTVGRICSVCDETLVAQTPLEARGHTPTEVDVLLPTYSTAGMLGGSYCVECRVVLSQMQTLAPYRRTNSTHGYDALAARPNGEALLALYDRLEAIAVAFHENYEKQIDKDQSVVGSAKYADLGLTLDEAFMVWNMYKTDRPIFYWIHTSLGYSDEAIYLLTSEHYVDGDVREACDALLYRAIYDMAPDTDSPYAIADLYHDTILYGMDYAYKADGVTPEDALWAHNIMGYFEKGSGVCESYARTLQLLLNYYGVENYLVIGEAGGGGHAWNLIRLDDGEWYWIDLTWDDRPKADEGTPEDYTDYFFCVNDTEVVDFLASHTPDTPDGEGFYFQYELPARAEGSYVPQKTAA